MTTIILTIIGILLAAAAALMVIFYGGDAFNSGTVGAQANQLQNAGTNVVSAAQMFRAETGRRPANVAALLAPAPNGAAGAFLDERPALPAGLAATAGEITTTGALTLYSVSGIPDAVCARVNANLQVTPTALPTTTVPGVKMGCVRGADAETPGTFFARA